MGPREKLRFATELSSIQWEPMYLLPSCDEQFNFFQTTIDELMTNCFPYKTVTRHSGDKPWVTDAFRQLIRGRERARMTGDRVLANQLRNQVTRAAPRLRHQFYQSKIASLEQSSYRDWWKHMKSLMGLLRSNTELIGLANRHTDGDLMALANRINEFFVSVSEDMPRLTSSHPIFDLSDPLPHDFIISVSDTETALNKVKVNKATGPDNVPAWILRDFAVLLAGPLSSIFNCSLREGVLPDLWKTATIIPLPKKHPPTLIEKDIRPISLTPIVSNVFEALVLKWVDSVIGPQLDDKQFGSISGTCTTDALVEMVHRWYEATDSLGTRVRVLLLDYSKAFDLINHHRLIDKLEAFGIPPHVVRWMAAFLLDRNHNVRIGDVLSGSGAPNGGVPQGTLSGPKNFLVQINDLSTPCPIFKYVDDSTIFEICGPETVSRLQESADVAAQWSRDNDMKINASKTHKLLIDFSKHQACVDGLSNITMDNQVIERTDSAKILGVTISSDLTWNTHVDNIVNKASKRLYMMYQLKRAGINQADLTTIYLSVIRPVLEYACPVWSTCLPAYLSEKIETVQKRAMRTIYPGFSYTDTLEILNIAPLATRRVELCTKYFNDMKRDGHKLNHLLPDERTVPYNLRTSNVYPVIKTRTSRYQKSFLPWCLSNCQ